MFFLKDLKLERVFLFILVSLLVISSAHAIDSPENIWSEISAQEMASNRNANKTREDWIRPDKYRSFGLNKENLQKLLVQAPLESPEIDDQYRAQPTLIHLPTPDGKYMAFEFVESPVMSNKLAEKFPEIKTYFGVSAVDPTITVRFDLTPKGFHAQVLAPGQRWYIDPHFKDDTSIYASYYKKDYHPVKDHSQCLLETHKTQSRTLGTSERSGDILRTYDLAVATTGEYGQFHGGTTLGAMSAVTTTINRVTGIYEKELAVRLSLVDDNDTIIYTDPGKDPFTGNLNAPVLTGESQLVIDTQIGTANYDIGHTFSTGAGGLAGLGVVCNDSSKARGVTGTSQPVGDAFDVDFVAHEIGHQFAGNHTFNGALGNCSGSNRNGSTAYEPGSGSTIQAYAGICGSDNLQNNSTPIFHSESHAEMMTYITVSGSCSTNTSISNAIPTVDAGSDYTIPAQTPFVLTGVGNDTNGDNLTYLWEQRDLGPQSRLSAADDGQIPLFRVQTPTTDPVRYLPKLSSIINNTTENTEKLPQVNRTMNWRLTARDNKGGVESDDSQVTVSASAGPFLVTTPNGGENLSAITDVTWNVANTASAPVSAFNVDIFLSTDGGLTYPTTLIANTPNDGSQTVNLPNIATSQARVMVKGTNNIFFDISNQNFSIAAGTAEPTLNGPSANSTLTGSSQTFNWSSNGTDVLKWGLYIGSSVGSNDIYNSGSLGTSLSTTVNGLPIDGSIVYVSLWYRTSAGWQSVASQYTTSSNTFDETKTQLIDITTSVACEGVTMAVVNLNSGTNSLIVDLSFNGDLDLGVKEPDGTCVWYNNTSSSNGGAHSGDVISGGTEQYTITNGSAGAYSVVVHHHNGAQNGTAHIFGTNGSVNFAAKSITNSEGFAIQEEK